MRARLGQHFLIDKNIAKKIVDSLELIPNDTVIEIGPGKGILTQFIVTQVKSLITVEIDKNLCHELEKKYDKYENIKIICDDFLKWEIPHSVSRLQHPLKFVGNLPYYISSPVLGKVLKLKNWQVAVFTMQKEVAERIIAEPHTKNYGVLTLLTQFYANAKIVKRISSTCFYPKPEVISAVVKFTPRISDTEYSTAFTNKLFKVIRNAFKHRRKTICNSFMLCTVFLKNISKDSLINILSHCDISPSARAENVILDEYIKLTIELDKVFNIV